MRRAKSSGRRGPAQGQRRRRPRRCGAGRRRAEAASSPGRSRGEKVRLSRRRASGQEKGERPRSDGASDGRPAGRAGPEDPLNEDALEGCASGPSNAVPVASNATDPRLARVDGCADGGMSGRDGGCGVACMGAMSSVRQGLRQRELIERAGASSRAPVAGPAVIVLVGVSSLRTPLRWLVGPVLALRGTVLTAPVLCASPSSGHAPVVSSTRTSAKACNAPQKGPIPSIFDFKMLSGTPDSPDP